MATIESVKAKIRGLIDKINATTGNADTQLAPAVDVLVAGYGGGGGGFVDVAELPNISEAEEGVVYRLVQETEASADILVSINDGSSVTTMTLAEMFVAQGASANIPIYIVPELPEVMKPIDEATLTVPFYIVESTGIAYLSLDGTNVNIATAGELFDAPDGNGGWVESADSIPTDNLQLGMNIFCVKKEASVEIKGLYLAVDGKWQAYKEVIDVEELPASGVNKHAIYRVGKYVTKDLYKVLAGGEIKPYSEWLIENGYEDNISFNRAEFVDTIPATHDSTVAYIHNTTGAMYVDNGSGNLVPFVSDSLVTILLGNYYGLCDAEAVDLGQPGLYAVREGIVIDKYCVNTGGKWREFKSKSIFQEYAAGTLTELKSTDLLGIYRIADHSLANCKPLEKVTFPSSVGVIGKSAFENCENLKEIEFNESVMGLLDRAFYGCKSITEIDWYALRNLWDLGQEAFANCTSLKHANPTSGDNGGGYIFNANPSGMFDGCTALETATIDFKPDAGFLGVGGMFEGCTSLHTFTDNVGMDCMPVGMFKGCSSLKDIYVPATKVGWSSWEKGEKWDQGTPDYVIHCTDGDILKSDPESGSDDTPDAPESSGMELNIAYGDTAPEDTSKLWVKTSEPSGVVVKPVVEYTNGEPLVETPYWSGMSGGNGCKSFYYSDKLYVTAAGTATDIRCRDFVTNTNTTLPVQWDSGAKRLAQIGSKIYAFGGTSKTAQCVDLETQEIETFDITLPGRFVDTAIVAVGTKIFLFGGTSSSSSSSYTREIWCFDTDTHEFIKLSTEVPTDAGVVYDLSAVAYDGKVYLFGGKTGASAVNYRDRILEFDPETEVMTILDAKLFTSASRFRGVMDSVVYFFGCSGRADDRPKLVKYFDMKTKVAGITVVLSTFQAPSGEIWGSTVGDVIYFPRSSGSIWQIFNPKTYVAVPNNELLIKSEQGTDTFTIQQGDFKCDVDINVVFKGNENNIGEKVDAALYKDNTWTNI